MNYFSLNIVCIKFPYTLNIIVQGKKIVVDGSCLSPMNSFGLKSAASSNVQTHRKSLGPVILFFGKVFFCICLGSICYLLCFLSYYLTFVLRIIITTFNQYLQFWGYLLMQLFGQNSQKITIMKFAVMK